MLKQIPIAIAVVLIVASALLQGTWSERWSSFPELETYAKRLQNVPLDIADWQGQEGEELDPRMKQVAGAVGDLHRTYSNSTEREAVTIDIVCGRPHDMFIHTPDRCYPAAGFEKGGTQSQANIEGVEGDFFTNTYIKSEPNGTQNLRVYWTWCANGKWEAPTDFKWKFGGSRVLYKLYVMVPLSNREEAPDHNAAAEFIRVLIPELNRTLFGADKAPAKAAAAATEKKS